MSRASLNPTNLIALAADPASAQSGDAYWSTSLRCVRVYNGTAWESWVTATVGTTAPSSPVSGDLWFDTNEPGVLELTDFAGTPATPTGAAKLWATTRAGRRFAALMGPSGLDSLLQPHIAFNNVSLYIPVENATTFTIVGGSAITATGTATAAAFTAPTTSTAAALHLSAKRHEYLVGTAAANAVAGWRQARNTFSMSSAAGMGGFFHVQRFSPATGGTGATRRLFAGVGNSTAAPTDVNPASITNILGVGYDSADTNWQIFNSGTTTGGKTSTGIARPSTDRPGIYQVCVFCAPGSLAPTVEFKDLFTGQSFSRSFTAGATVPANGTALSARGWASIGTATAGVVGFTTFGAYIETDN